MEDRIRIFLNNYINGLYFPTVHLTDVIEILIITVIVYEIMLWIKNTKAVSYTHLTLPTKAEV